MTRWYSSPDRETAVLKRLQPPRRSPLAWLPLEDGPSKATLSTWQPE